MIYSVVDRGTAIPPSRQLAALLRTQIEDGTLPAGTQLPTIQALSAEHGLATNTVRKALAILRSEGLIESTPGYGTFVRTTS